MHIYVAMIMLYVMSVAMKQKFYLENFSWKVSALVLRIWGVLLRISQTIRSVSDFKLRL